MSIRPIRWRRLGGNRTEDAQELQPHSLGPIHTPRTLDTRVQGPHRIDQNNSAFTEVIDMARIHNLGSGCAAAAVSDSEDGVL
jgi:hypothetical protein